MSSFNDEARAMYMARNSMPSAVGVATVQQPRTAPAGPVYSDDRDCVMTKFFNTVKKLFKVEPTLRATAHYVQHERLCFERDGRQVIISVNASCSTTVMVDMVKYPYYHSANETFPDEKKFTAWVEAKKAEDPDFASLFPKPFFMKVVLNGCYGGFGLSKEAVALLTSRGYDAKHKDSDVLRVSPEVISVVEELRERASASGSSLYVVKVPLPQDQWHVDDYDGCERVRENHRVWE